LAIGIQTDVSSVNGWRGAMPAPRFFRKFFASATFAFEAPDSALYTDVVDDDSGWGKLKVPVVCAVRQALLA
jgi:hypothetical protein